VALVHLRAANQRCTRDEVWGTRGLLVTFLCWFLPGETSPSHSMPSHSILVLLIPTHPNTFCTISTRSIPFHSVQAIPSYLIPTNSSHPTQSHSNKSYPILSHPIPSHPIPSHPILSIPSHPFASLVHTHSRSQWMVDTHCVDADVKAFCGCISDSQKGEGCSGATEMLRRDRDA